MPTQFDTMNGSVLMLDSEIPAGQASIIHPADSSGGSTSTRGYVIANDFTGADIGAQINAACASLPLGGNVLVLDGDYVQTTKVVVTENVALYLGRGVISNTFPDGAIPHFLLKNGASIIGASGWSSKIMEQEITGAGGPSVSDFISGTDNSLIGNMFLKISEVQFIRNPGSTTTPQSAAVQFGNIRNAVVRRCFFNGCSGYGVAQASSSISGHAGDGFFVRDCTFENIGTQQCVVINCNNFQITGNLFRPTDALANYTVIDCESNTDTDTLSNFLIDGNQFDFSTSNIFNPGSIIQVVGGSGVPYSNGRAKFGTISNNVCLGGAENPEQSFFAQGINLADCDYVTISDNQIHFANVLISVGDSNTCVISDNTVGISGNNDAWHILIGHSFDCYVVDNKCIDHYDDHNHSTPNIAETGGSDYNIFAGNWINFYPDTTPVPPTTERYPKITLVGANSRVYGTVTGKTPTQVDTPLIISVNELRNLYPPGARNANSPAVLMTGGYAGQCDGGWAIWKYDPLSVLADNGVTVIVPFYRSGAVGAWLRAPSQIRLTGAARDALALGAGDAGLMIWNTDTSALNIWNGAAWKIVTVA